MQIILLESIDRVGKAGDVVAVKDGYANNFLLPKKLAIVANKKNKLNLNSKLEVISKQNEIKTRLKSWKHALLKSNEVSTIK